MGALRILPESTRPLGLPVYFVTESERSPEPLTVLTPNGERAQLTWFREGREWKAELTGYASGVYTATYGGEAYTLHFREEGRLGFGTEFGFTVLAVALGFALWLGRHRGGEKTT